MPEPFVYQSTTCHPPTKKTLIKGLFLDSRGRYWLQRRTPSDGITLNTSLICGNERCSKLHFQAFAGTTFLVFANLRFPSCFVDVRQFSAGSNVIPERISINCQEWKKGQKIGPKWLFNPKWVTSYWFEGCSGHLQGQNIWHAGIDLLFQTISGAGHETYWTNHSKPWKMKFQTSETHRARLCSRLSVHTRLP